ncbi:MAG: hypothetical protein M5U09_19780 [Gammaproteobacteria bacterium]|nr:hypothetical protein [Gammaproteobacteria bacterium]
MLSELGLSYAIWNTANSDREPGAAELEKYRAVLWTSGMAVGGEFVAGPGSDGEGALETYLVGGGCPVVSSQTTLPTRG